jgi:hypothetical protein
VRRSEHSAEEGRDFAVVLGLLWVRRGASGPALLTFVGAVAALRPASVIVRAEPDRLPYDETPPWSPAPESATRGHSTRRDHRRLRIRSCLCTGPWVGTGRSPRLADSGRLNLTTTVPAAVEVTSSTRTRTRTGEEMRE